MAGIHILNGETLAQTFVSDPGTFGRDRQMNRSETPELAGLVLYAETDELGEVTLNHTDKEIFTALKNGANVYVNILYIDTMLTLTLHDVDRIDEPEEAIVRFLRAEYNHLHTDISVSNVYYLEHYPEEGWVFGQL